MSAAAPAPRKKGSFLRISQCGGDERGIALASDCKPRFAGFAGLRVPRMHPVAKLWMQCCTRDEGRPLGSGVQTRLSNHLELLPLRAVVVSVKEKAGCKPRGLHATRQVRALEMNESELSLKCRKQSDDVESASCKLRVISPAGVWRLAGRHPACRQHEHGTGSCTERGNLSSRCEGSGAKQRHCERLSTDAGHRGRWPRSSDEAPVMGVERRGSVVGVDLSVNCEIRMSP